MDFLPKLNDGRRTPFRQNTHLTKDVIGLRDGPSLDLLVAKLVGSVFIETKYTRILKDTGAFPKT